MTGNHKIFGGNHHDSKYSISNFNSISQKIQIAMLDIETTTSILIAKILKATMIELSISKAKLQQDEQGNKLPKKKKKTPRYT